MTATAGSHAGAAVLTAPFGPETSSDRNSWPLVASVVAGACVIGLTFAFGSDYALVMVMALAAILALVVLLAWPVLALPAAVFLIWANVPVVLVGAGAPSVITIVVPLILLAPLATSFVRGETLTVDRIFLSMLVLLGIYVISTAASPQPTFAAKQTMSFVLEGIVLYLLVFNAVRTPAALRRAAWAILAAGTFLAAITVFQNLTQTYHRPYFGFAPLDIQFFLGKGVGAPRAHGPVGDPNYFAQILVATIALALPLLWRERRRLVQLVIAGSVGIMLMALAFTFSRGGLLALGIVMIAMVVLGYLRLRHLAAMALVLAVIVSVVPGYRDRVTSIANVGGVTAQVGSSNEADEAIQGRFTENRAAILVFLDYPMLGVGPGSFVAYYQEYANRTGGKVHRSKKRASVSAGGAVGEAPAREAHNLFLSAAAETGIFGLFALLAVFATAFAQLSRARRRWKGADPVSKYLMTGLLLALLSYLANGLFLSLAFERYLWLLLALVGAAAYIARTQASLVGGQASESSAR